ncbi:hypothetical protein [Sagittula sp. S175]|uniref:hypothetical protein n=1 Tax=Sagittula sp. S175 TaxID=3415129 RepID=UPI003C7AB185
MAKLIVIGIILAFFGAVLLVVQMNYRREMRDRETRVPTLDDQLDTLVRAGLPLRAGVTRDTLLARASEEDYRTAPWARLLLELARDTGDGAPCPCTGDGAPAGGTVVLLLDHASGTARYTLPDATAERIQSLAPGLLTRLPPGTPR